MSYSEHKEEWARLYTEEGWSQPEIAKEYGCHQSTVSKYLREMDIRKRPNKARFWRKVQKGEKNECWQWKGNTSRGYGYFWNGEREIPAHRFSYALKYGQPDQNKYILHKCDNPSCVNPNHLYEGSQQDNMDDKVERARQARGERHPSAKLTSEDVQNIRHLYDNTDLTQYDLADKFDIDRTVISDIVNDKIWTHL